MNLNFPIIIYNITYTFRTNYLEKKYKRESKINIKYEK